FLLELVALGAMGYWGWTQQDGAWRWIAALGIPLIAAVVWASFRVPGDQERNGAVLPGNDARCCRSSPWAGRAKARRGRGTGRGTPADRSGVLRGSGGSAGAGGSAPCCADLRGGHRAALRPVV